MLLLLRTRGTRHAAELVEKLSSRRFAARRQPVNAELVEQARQIGSGVNRAAADPAPPVTCLARSLTAQLLLRRRGIDAELRIGVGRVDVDPGGATSGPAAAPLAFHAWVEVDGIPVNDADDVAQRFAPFPLEQVHLRGRRSQT